MSDLYAKEEITLDLVHLDASFVPAKRGGDKIGISKLGKESKAFSIVENTRGLSYELVIISQALILKKKHL
ncbi:hypothetical protein SAMN05444392_12327 [Seinonella peptonophila]|uniref:Uncharacterized protein n=2 Tax=Seinonella peptonophila TaxID=112248 RepID=A0A1M5BH86_9BACL|nr:hypothetical protein SAMN05444392_12327 [Seinonella peptonophila]